MPGIDRVVERFCESRGLSRLHDPVGFAHKANPQRKPIDGLKRALQDLPRGMVSTHPIHRDPKAITVIDQSVITGLCDLQAAQRVHHRLEHLSSHAPRVGDDASCHRSDRFSHVPCSVGRGGSGVDETGHGAIAPIPNHKSSYRLGSACFAPGFVGRAEFRILRVQRNR